MSTTIRIANEPRRVADESIPLPIDGCNIEFWSVGLDVGAKLSFTASPRPGVLSKGPCAYFTSKNANKSSSTVTGTKVGDSVRVGEFDSVGWPSASLSVGARVGNFDWLWFSSDVSVVGTNEGDCVSRVGDFDFVGWSSGFAVGARLGDFDWLRLRSSDVSVVGTKVEGDSDALFEANVVIKGRLGATLATDDGVLLSGRAPVGVSDTVGEDVIELEEGIIEGLDDCDVGVSDTVGEDCMELEVGIIEGSEDCDVGISDTV